MKYMAHFFIALFSFFLLFPAVACAQADGEYIEELVLLAKDKNLAKSREWEVILHYKTTLARRFHSLINDKSFFLAPNGATNAEDELEANIRLIFGGEVADISDDDSAYCRFPRRRLFFSEQLNIDEARINKRECAKLEKYKQNIDPHSVTLVFPFMYIARPASMFGHTLLRINGRSNDALRGYSVIFTADMSEDDNMLNQVFLGLFGGYDGVYNIKEYYKTIFEYSNIDKRDIWEYDLNLTPEETLKLFYHIYEVENKTGEYWFFDQNCSYNLLFLLEAARPDVELTTSIFIEAPSDTLKRVNDVGLMKGAKYRPSVTNKIENFAVDMDKSAVSLGIAVGKGEKEMELIEASDYDDKMKASTYDIAIEVMQNEYLQKEVTGETLDEYGDFLIALLKGRAAYKIKSDYPIDEPTPPHLSHDIARTRVATGFTNGQFYTELGFKAGYHSLYDIDDGYVANSGVEALGFNVRWNSATGYIALQDMVVLSLASYSPVSKISTNVSWKATLGGVQKYFKEGNMIFTPYLDGRVGSTFKVFRDTFIWTMGVADVSLASGYVSFAGIGLGANIGASYSFKWGKVLADATYKNYVLGGFGNEAEANAAYIFPINRNNTLMLKYQWTYSWGKMLSDVSLSWQFYF